MAIETNVTRNAIEQPVEVAGQLLERDARRDMAGRGDEVEAAAPRLRGERARQGQDRPQAER